MDTDQGDSDWDVITFPRAGVFGAKFGHKVLLGAPPYDVELPQGLRLAKELPHNVPKDVIIVAVEVWDILTLSGEFRAALGICPLSTVAR